MGASESMTPTRPNAKARTSSSQNFRIGADGKLTPGQFLFIVDNYMLATRLYESESKYRQISKDDGGECWQRFLIHCGKDSLKQLRKHGITGMRVCISKDYSRAMYTINGQHTHTITLGKEQRERLEAINDELQRFNGYGSQSPCYARPARPR